MSDDRLCPKCEHNYLIPGIIRVCPHNFCIEITSIPADGEPFVMGPLPEDWYDDMVTDAVDSAQATFASIHPAPDGRQ